MTPSDFSEPKYQDLAASFLHSENKGTYLLIKTIDGKQFQVKVSPPEWMASTLKH